MPDAPTTAARNAYICTHAEKGKSDCSARVFVQPGETPRCREHGTRYMERQVNKPYLGQPTEAAAR